MYEIQLQPNHHDLLVHLYAKPIHALCSLHKLEGKFISVDRLLPNTDHANPPMKACAQLSAYRHWDREAAAMRCVDRDVVTLICGGIGDGDIGVRVNVLENLLRGVAATWSR